MENQRLFLFLALSLVILLIWTSWNERNSTKSISTTDKATADTVVSSPKTAVDSINSPPINDAPKAPTSTQKVENPSISTQTTLTTGNRIHVVTPLYDVEIDLTGGDIRRVFLKKYPVSLEEPNRPYPLMDDALPQLFIAQTGLLGNVTSPDHHSIFSAEKSEYTLDNGQTELRVPLTWTSPDGLIVVKTITFKPDDYLVQVDHEIRNNSASSWKGRLYRQLQRSQYEEVGHTRMLYTFTGGAVSTPSKPYEKIAFDKMADWKPEESYVKGGWAAVIQHYFVVAWVPGADEINHIFTRNLNNERYILGLTSDEYTVEPGASTNLPSRLYIGPKIQERLEQIEPNLKLTVDYGILAIIGQPMFWALKYIHSVVNNWGWAIILLTILIKLVFYKLSESSYKSMARNKELAPKFQALRERYGDDRQRMSQAYMELIKKEKFNPFSGCWPMLIQIPFFIAFYWVILESVELRQAPFALWIHDLAAKDPFYVLPILMGLSMWYQQKLSFNPAMDPMQQKILQFMPLVFTFFFMLFPAGLVLYWVVNSVLSIAQQQFITWRLSKIGINAKK